ncbi:MAG: hypothetical protein LBD12_05795, partial [Clostridiales Family XIII bacterium]|nr:hypothetical protein [Clostridiales Family XIII bacterium]
MPVGHIYAVKHFLWKYYHSTLWRFFEKKSGNSDKNREVTDPAVDRFYAILAPCLYEIHAGGHAHIAPTAKHWTQSGVQHTGMQGAK